MKFHIQYKCRYTLCSWQSRDYFIESLSTFCLKEHPGGGGVWSNLQLKATPVYNLEEVLRDLLGGELETSKEGDSTVFLGTFCSSTVGPSRANSFPFISATRNHSILSLWHALSLFPYMCFFASGRLELHFPWPHLSLAFFSPSQVITGLLFFLLCHVPPNHLGH